MAASIHLPETTLHIYKICSLILAMGWLGCAGPRPSVNVAPMGRDKVKLRIYEQPGAALRMVVLHDDENTAVRVGKKYVRRQGGRLVELHQRGRRMVRLRMPGGTYHFDPNRMFTPAGLRSSMEKQGGYPEQGVQIAAAFAGQILQAIGAAPGDTIIALHNNTPDRLTIHSFEPGGEYGPDASRVHVAGERDRDDFFFVTSAVLFERLAAAGFNVAQTSEGQRDDGSLSYYCDINGITYVNIEAQRGHFRQQYRMLTALAQALR